MNLNRLTNIKKFVFLSFFFISFSLIAYKNDSCRAIKPKSSFKMSLKKITKLLKESNELNLRLDEKFSETVFANFINLLDENKIFFLQDNVDTFDSNKNKFSYVFNLYEMSYPFEIFSRYRCSLEQYFNAAIEHLSSDNFNPYKSDIDFESFVNQKNPKDHEEQKIIWLANVEKEYIKLLEKNNYNKGTRQIAIDHLKKLFESVKRHDSHEAFYYFINAILFSADPHSVYTPYNISNIFDLNNISIVNAIKHEEFFEKRIISEFKDLKLKDQKIGYMKIPSFYADIFNKLNDSDEDKDKSSSVLVGKALSDFKDNGIKSLIIDLRDNSGGSLKIASEILNYFVHGNHCFIKKSSEIKPYRAEKNKFFRDLFYEGDLYVLVNRKSASASELFAAAIQDYKVGLIVGANTYGKGTIQGEIPVPSGIMSLTFGKYLRVTGEATQIVGVTPDIELYNTYDPLKIGESTFENALSLN